MSDDIEQSPPPLPPVPDPYPHYRPPERGPRGPDRHPGAAPKLLAGLMAGSLVSVALWVFGWHPPPQRENTKLAYGVMMLKAVVAVLLMVVPQFRMFGAGILLSIGIGFLIFIGTCGGL
jgi:hypothetical protein